MSSTAKNLEAIQRAIVKHNGNCDGRIIEIQLCPFEVERLGFDEFRGIPIVADEKLSTGRFRLVCDAEPESGTPIAERALEGAGAR